MTKMLLESVVIDGVEYPLIEGEVKIERALTAKEKEERWMPPINLEVQINKATMRKVGMALAARAGVPFCWPRGYSGNSHQRRIA